MTAPGTGRDPIRLTVVMTHPVQYLAPWFRHLAAEQPEIELAVLYATEPTARQQGTGFATEFTWDVALTEGYAYRVLRPANPGMELSSSAYHGVDAPEVGAAILETAPDAVLIPGWHSRFLTRAIDACRRYRIPLLYRGDSHLGTAPSGWRRPLWEWRTRQRLSRFDAWLAVGSRAREYLAQLAPGAEAGAGDGAVAGEGAGAGTRTATAPIFDSPHAVDNAFFAEAAAPHLTPEGRGAARRELGVAGIEPVILFAGKLAPIKRPLDLVRAAARLGQRLPYAPRLLFAGGGELEEACRAEAERLGVEAAWAGFLNQSELPRAYAAADLLALPSSSESWGLVVNEAMATGLAAVVSDGVGCAPDLIVPGLTGERFPVADLDAFAAALARAVSYARVGDTAAACRDQVARFSFEAASAGLLAACRAVSGPRFAAHRRGASGGEPSSTGDRRAEPLAGARVLAPCGGMVVVAGLERQTFELLRTLREAGATVHCLLNDWESHRIEPLAEEIGATWSSIPYRGHLDRHARNPFVLAKTGWQLLRTDRALARAAKRFAPTHVLVPELGALLRGALALRRLRRRGVPVLLRVGNAPERGRFYRRLWSRVIPPLIDLAVANSRFGLLRLRQEGVPPAKTALVRNRVARRRLAPEVDAEVVARVERRTTLLVVGQLAPFKGTHLAVEAALALLARGHDLQMVLVGRRPAWPPELVRYVEQMEARVAEADAGERVRFAGERANVPAIMARAHLLVAPIVQEETFGNVVLEAAREGLPAVIFPRGGLLELVEEGESGWICPQPTLESLIATLETALADPAAVARAGSLARERATREESPYHPDRYARAWVRVFTRLGPDCR